MAVARHISIDDEHFEKMKPFVERNGGNFGAAIREIIQQAGRYGIGANASSVDTDLLDWILKEIDGILVPLNVLDEIIDPVYYNSMNRLEEYLNKKFMELKWEIDISIRSDNDTFPAEVLIEINGHVHKIKFVSGIICQYLVKNSLERSPLEIKSIDAFNDRIMIELSRSNKRDAQKSLAGFFGDMNEISSALKSRPAFWKTIVNRTVLNNYYIVTIHRNCFEDLLADKIPLGEITIETMARKPIHEIPLKEMLSLIKEIYETSRIADRVDIDNETIVVSHNYRTKEAIEKLKKCFIAILEASGHLYDARSTANMIVLRHRPDVGIKINEIVDKLKESNSKVDQELMMFIGFLRGLRDIPDIPITITALGKRIGKSLMQEYEKENGIINWNMENFQKAIEIIDSRLHRESEWKAEGNNLLYRVRKCNIASEGEIFDTYVCHTARETFKGALNYAFGNKAELSIKKLLTHGDNFCEVVIHIP